MATFIRLASLTDQGIRNVKNLSTMIAEARQIMEKHGARLVEGWVTLGEYDLIVVIDAPDANVAAEVSALIGAKGNFRARTVPAIPLAEFCDAVDKDT